MKRCFKKSLALLMVVIMLVPMFVTQASAAVTFERKLGVPIDYQFNYTTVRYGTNKSTASSGCGAASASMVVEYYTGNTSQSPDTLFKWACDNGWYTGSGLSYAAVKKLCSNYGVTLNWVGTQSEIIAALKAGYPIIALMGPGTFTSGGHYIVLSGIKIDGGTTYIRVNDPNSSSRTNNYYTLSTIWSEKRTSSSTPFGVCTYTSAPKRKVDDFYVEPGKYSKVVSSDGSLNIRGSASGSGTLLGTVPSGTLVKVESISGNWSYITYNGISGYVNSPYLKDPGQEAIAAPTITAPTTLDYGTSGSVSWAAVSGATSYSYTATAYPGEISAGNGKTIASGSGTGTSFTIPAQTTGKYIRVSVTAQGAINSASSSADIMVGPWASAPSGVQYISIADINGDQWTTGGSTVWTASKGSTFSAVWWTAALCTPNSDGSYTVSSVYASGGSSKSISVTDNNILIATHSNEESHKYMAELKVGDKITLHGIYLDKATIRGTGYILVNGGIPLAPTDITASNGNITKTANHSFRGFQDSTTVSDAKASFTQNGEYMQIRNAAGVTVADTDVLCTGYTVNIVVDSDVTVSYSIVVNGDTNGDGALSSSDYLEISSHVSGSVSLDSAYAEAADTNGDNNISSSDFSMLMLHILGKTNMN